MRLSGWGRYPRIDCATATMRSAADARDAILGHRSLIPRGNGRSYGDAALNGACVLSTLCSDRILALLFRPLDGIMCAGLVLGRIFSEFPRCRAATFFLPVTPGTKFVYHRRHDRGRRARQDHHRHGAFGAPRRKPRSVMTRGRGGEARSATELPSPFAAACGGMGLFGLILRRHSPYARSRPLDPPGEVAARGRHRRGDGAGEAATGWTYIRRVDRLPGATAGGSARDRLSRRACAAGRGSRGDAKPPARGRARCRSFSALGAHSWSVRAFNELYRPAGQGRFGLRRLSTPTSTRSTRSWNGTASRWAQRPGAISMRRAQGASRARSAKSCGASWRRAAAVLAVRQLLGPEGAGLLSLPTEGYTLTLDFPVDAGDVNLLHPARCGRRRSWRTDYLAKDCAWARR